MCGKEEIAEPFDFLVEMLLVSGGMLILSAMGSGLAANGSFRVTSPSGHRLPLVTTSTLEFSVHMRRMRPVSLAKWSSALPVSRWWRRSAGSDRRRHA